MVDSYMNGIKNALSQKGLSLKGTTLGKRHQSFSFEIYFVNDFALEYPIKFWFSNHWIYKKKRKKSYKYELIILKSKFKSKFENIFLKKVQRSVNDYNKELSQNDDTLTHEINPKYLAELKIHVCNSCLIEFETYIDNEMLCKNCRKMLYD